MRPLAQSFSQKVEGQPQSALAYPLSSADPRNVAPRLPGGRAPTRAGEAPGLIVMRAAPILRTFDELLRDWLRGSPAISALMRKLLVSRPLGGD